jgi:hypothetical protein
MNTTSAEANSIETMTTFAVLSSVATAAWFVLSNFLA